MKKNFLFRAASVILFAAFLGAFFPFSLAAKGNKVPFISPGGTRQETEKSRAYERDLRAAPPVRPENAQTTPGKEAPSEKAADPARITIETAVPEDELRFTVTLPAKTYAEGEYRPRRPDRFSAKTGKIEFKLDRAERGTDEVTAITVKSSVPDWKGSWTPLHTAAAAGDLETANRVLDEGTVTVDASPEFLTPLQTAAVMGEEDAARLLLGRGADITVKTPDGKNPAELAAFCRHPELARLLTVFTVAQKMTGGGKTVTVKLDGGGSADLTEELKRIASGRRDGHRRDGSVFGNYEGKLPRRDRYYYTEFVHRTGSRSSPGPRRIVIGMNGDVWYTADHYSSFQRVAP